MEANINNSNNYYTTWFWCEWMIHFEDIEATTTTKKKRFEVKQFTEKLQKLILLPPPIGRRSRNRNRRCPVWYKSKACITCCTMLDIFRELRGLLRVSHVHIDSWVFRLHYSVTTTW